MSLKKLCQLLNWNCRRWKDVVSKVKNLETLPSREKEVETELTDTVTSEKGIVWPQTWNDRGSIRSIENKKNYPDAGPGVVYAWQISTLLTYPIERVLKYHLLQGADGLELPNWWRSDRYGSYHCTEDHAKQIVERIRFHRNTNPISKSNPSTMTADEISSRKRALARLRQNSETMLRYYLVVTPGYNDKFLSKLGISALGELDVDAVLRAENIRLVSLDNPERWTMDGNMVEPKKLLGLHPTDVASAIRVLKVSLSKAIPVLNERERSERATVVWLPMKSNGWQHPDEGRTVYPSGISRLALNRSGKDVILRGWGINLDSDTIPINGCDVNFRPTQEGYFEALLDKDELEEILL